MKPKQQKIYNPAPFFRVIEINGCQILIIRDLETAKMRQLVHEQAGWLEYELGEKIAAKYQPEMQSFITKEGFIRQELIKEEEKLYADAQAEPKLVFLIHTNQGVFERRVPCQDRENMEILFRNLSSDGYIRAYLERYEPSLYRSIYHP